MPNATGVVEGLAPSAFVTCALVLTLLGFGLYPSFVVVV